MTKEPDMQSARDAYQVLLFYKYVTIDAPEELAETVRSLATELSLIGRVIVAAEGINATLEGTVENTESFVARFILDGRFADIQIKRSAGNGKSFSRLSVKVRDEIVSTGFTSDEADPRVSTAPKLSAEELRDWYENERDFVVVDMRNNYEFASGHFKDSVEPGISASRHLPLMLDKLASLKEKTIVTVCTGGVRCEKMSAYLMNKDSRTSISSTRHPHLYGKVSGQGFLGDALYIRSTAHDGFRRRQGSDRALPLVQCGFRAVRGLRGGYMSSPFYRMRCVQE